MTEPRPVRMYTDAERNARPRDLWDLSHWVDYVEAGETRAARIRRVAEVPAWALAQVTEKCKRRAAGAVRRAREGGSCA